MSMDKTKMQHFRVSRFEYGFIVQDDVIKSGGCPGKYIGWNIHEAIFDIKKDPKMLVEAITEFKAI